MAYTKITNFAIKDSTNDIIKGTEFDDEFNSIEASFTAQPSATQTLTNKTVALGSNTVSGTFAQFNTAVTDAELARTDAANTFTGTQTFGDVTTTGNTILGNASTDTLNVGNGDLIKDASGNLGVGVTPSTWQSNFKAIELGFVGSGVSTNASGKTIVASNYYFNSGDKFAATGFASLYQQASGSHYWGASTASGTAGGAITFTSGMTLDAAGQLGVGCTPSGWTLGKVVELGTVGNSLWSAGIADIRLTANTYYNGVFRYAVTGSAAATFEIGGGAYTWRTAASGTAGNTITWTDSMTLDASGLLTVGTGTSGNPNARLQVIASSAANGVISAMQPNSATGVGVASASVTAAGGGWYHFVGQSGNGSVVNTNNILIYGNGNVQNTSNSYGAISDVKLKENIVDASPKLAKLMQVKIRNYNLKDNYEQHKQIGVIAQELETVFPSLIEETEDRKTVTKTREVEVPAVDEVLDEEGNVVTPEVEATTITEEYTEQVLTGETTKSVKYSVFVPILIKAMQEQQAMIDELKAKVAALEAA